MRFFRGIFLRCRIASLCFAGAIPAGLSAPCDIFQGSPCIAEILHEKDDGIDAFRAVVKNNGKEPFEGTYTLELIRQGRAGRSVSRQRGSFQAAGHETVDLGVTKVNITGGDNYTVILKIYREEIFICADSITADANLQEAIDIIKTN